MRSDLYVKHLCPMSSELKGISRRSKGKGSSRKGHAGPEVEQRYRSTLSLTSALDGGGCSTPRPGTHWTGGWVGPRARTNRCENLAPTWIRSPDRPARRESLYRLRYSGISRQILF